MRWWCWVPTAVAAASPDHAGFGPDSRRIACLSLHCRSASISSTCGSSPPLPVSVEVGLPHTEAEARMLPPHTPDGAAATVRSFLSSSAVPPVSCSYCSAAFESANAVTCWAGHFGSEAMPSEDVVNQVRECLLSRLTNCSKSLTNFGPSELCWTVRRRRRCRSLRRSSSWNSPWKGSPMGHPWYQL